MEPEKVCTKCGHSKTITTEFYPSKSGYRDGFTAQCRTCIRLRNNKTFRQLRFGVTEQQFQQMLADQQHKCAICLKISDKTLCMDHDHTTGKVRGLLCGECNKALGMLKDNVESLYRAIDYLHGSVE